jgi:hypothetical protein
MKRFAFIVLAALVLTACTDARTGPGRASPASWRVGQTVYVCGCPLMCCTSVSTHPGMCACNVPLRKATIKRIENGLMIVDREDGLRKVLPIARR